jgi:hypothetical protein
MIVLRCSRFFSNDGATRSTSLPVLAEHGRQYLRTSFFLGFIGASNPLSQISHFHLTCFAIFPSSGLSVVLSDEHSLPENQINQNQTMTKHATKPSPTKDQKKIKK